MDLIGKPGAAEAHPELEALLRDLAKTKLPARKSDRINVDGMVGELPVRPIYRRVKPVSTDRALVKVSEGAYPGIRYDAENQCKVVTNGNALLVYPTTIEFEESRTLSLYGDSIDGDYPNYKSVIPSTWEYESGPLKVADLLAVARGAVRAERFIDVNLRLVIETPEGFVTLAAPLAELSLEAAYLAGAREATVRANGFKDLVWFDCDALDLYVMPLKRYNAGDGVPFGEEHLLFKRLHVKF